MKKKIWIPIVISVVLIAGVFAALFVSNTFGDNEAKFVATILEINGDSVLVEPLENEKEHSCCDKISFNIANLEKIDVKVGSVVQITYDGHIMTSYPAQIKAISWKLQKQ